MNIVQRIKDRCNEMHITISSLPVSFDTSIIYRWDKASPNTNKISEVADMLNVSVDWLLGKTDVKNAFEEFERLQGTKIRIQQYKLLGEVERLTAGKYITDYQIKRICREVAKILERGGLVEDEDNKSW